MKFGVVVFPGSNCDEDLVHVLENHGGEVVKLWHKDTDLQGCDMICLPGGFSYGDYLRSGAIAKLSPIMDSVVEFGKNGGLVMGICNGFQILCEVGLLPGALLRNENQLFICDNVFLKVETTQTPVTSGYSKGQVIKIPIAHAEGRYFIQPEGLAELKQNDQILFTYCNEQGNPSNPNGSIEAIAGVTNKNRNVFGMMPHPERAAADYLGNTDGSTLFQSILDQVTA
jgi:phosphoribosylformylglycinamidine synthase